MTGYLSQHHAQAINLLAEHTGTRTQDWYLVFKARYGLQTVFEAIKSEAGPGNVLTQLFTCATAVNPIIAAGLTPAYGEVSPRTVALDPEKLPNTPHVRAVVLQNTFGIISDEDARALKRSAEQLGALLVEDSAHCVGRMARSTHGTPLADVSIHSFGVEKMLPTKYGGAVWINPEMDLAVSDTLRAMLEDLGGPGTRLSFAAATYRLQLGVLNRLPGSFSELSRRALTATGLFDPPIAPAELAGGQGSPVSLRANDWVAKHVAAGMSELSDVEKSRAAATVAYLEELEGKMEFPAAITPTTPLVRFPFFVPEGVDAETVFELLRDEGIYSGRWYRPALFPGVADPARYNWDPSQNRFPVTEDLIARVLNLPTSQNPQETRRIAQATLGLLR